jgi:hypothetical protein
MLIFSIFKIFKINPSTPFAVLGEILTNFDVFGGESY